MDTTTSIVLYEEAQPILAPVKPNLCLGGCGAELVEGYVYCEGCDPGYKDDPRAELYAIQ